MLDLELKKSQIFSVSAGGASAAPGAPAISSNQKICIEIGQLDQKLWWIEDSNLVMTKFLSVYTKFCDFFCELVYIF